MQVYLSTLFTLALLTWLARRGPIDGLVGFFFIIPFGMMAAANLPAVGGMSVLASDLVVVALVIMLLFRTRTFQDIDKVFRPGRAGFALIVFVLYATVATMFFPRVFAGETDVFSITRSAAGRGIELQPLGPGGGNLSQLQRLFLSTLAFAVTALAALRRPEPSFALRLVILVTMVHTTLGVLDIATQATGTTDLLAPIRTANYALTLGQRMAGLNRMIGGFPEASSYSYVSLALLGFWLSYWLDYRGNKRWPLAMMIATLLLVLRGTSSSAYVGLGLLLTIFAVMRVSEVGQRANALDRRLAGTLIVAFAALPLMIVGVYLAYSILPGFTDFIDRSLLDKIHSDSAAERGSWNRQAFVNLFDTRLLGAGLGSVRASNWVAATLGTTGVVGFALLVVFLWRLFRVPLSGRSMEAQHVAAALKMGCAGALSRALIVKASPNLDYIFFAMAGLLVGLTLAASHARNCSEQSERGALPE